MTAPTDVLDKINVLPEHVQAQLFHYVEFLYAIYRPESDTTETGGANISDKQELSEEGKRLLEIRVQKTLAYPEKRKHWRAVAEQIRQKYEWPNP
ncbi:MAG: DUF2281 domain-containing protein [Saprospiraceae bacterium]|nr:DUF2281 domain-containing protein [Saprospiraceae bacterium]